MLEAVAELDYRPHGPARALASGASHTIALFLPSPHWDLVPIQQTFVAGATQATSASDYSLLLSTSPTEPEDIVRLLAAGRADGVILMEILSHDPRVEALKASGHSFTLIGRTADTTGISFVDIDFGEAVRKSLEHLAELGHQTVALFNFPQDQLDAGYTSALIARDAFEETTAELDIRGIHLPSPAPAERGARGGDRAAPVGAGLHRRDHDRLAVHRPARRPPRRRYARPGRLLDRVGGRLAVRGDAHPGADLRRVAGIRGRTASRPRC